MRNYLASRSGVQRDMPNVTRSMDLPRPPTVAAAPRPSRGPQKSIHETARRNWARRSALFFLVSNTAPGSYQPSDRRISEGVFHIRRARPTGGGRGPLAQELQRLSRISSAMPTAGGGAAHRCASAARRVRGNKTPAWGGDEGCPGQGLPYR